MADDIDRMLVLIDKLASAVGEQVKTIERLDARVGELEQQAEVKRIGRWLSDVDSRLVAVDHRLRKAEARPKPSDLLASQFLDPYSITGERPKP